MVQYSLNGHLKYDEITKMPIRIWLRNEFKSIIDFREIFNRNSMVNFKIILKVVPFQPQPLTAIWDPLVMLQKPQL